jgi:required for meiotic nuclear division protein 1
MSDHEHRFTAIAFVENLALKELAGVFPNAKTSAHEIHAPLPEGGDIFLFPFGAIVFHDATSERRAIEMARLHSARPALTPQIVREEYTVRESQGAGIGIDDGVMTLDYFTPARTGVIALTVAQSAAMEYYESEVESLFKRTAALEHDLETRGGVSMKTRRLHKFIGEAISTRSEIVSVLHLLDKPEATWDDTALDAIYDDLKDEFDLVERYHALEMKIESVQNSLEIVLDVARDRRMVTLEAAIVVLFLFEIVMSFLRYT